MRRQGPCAEALKLLQHHGEVDPRLLRGWGLPQATGREWRLGHRNGSIGHVRLMQLDNAGPQADMRADDSYESIFERADQALYKAKQEGRNRAGLAA